MKNFFANVWTKRVSALISLLYAFGVCHLCYFSIFYDIHIHSRVQQCLTVTGVSILVLMVMLYTRKQIFTRIASFIILPAMLPVVLLYFGEWGMIIPIILTGVVILLLSGAGEGAKTAFGTITLLLYIFGARILPFHFILCDYHKAGGHRVRRISFRQIPLQSC